MSSMIESHASGCLRLSKRSSPATKAYPVIVDSLQPVLSPARFVGGKADIAVTVHTRMHRSTLVRKLRELHIDIRALRNAERRPPHGIRTHQQNRNVG